MGFRLEDTDLLIFFNAKLLLKRKRHHDWSFLCNTVLPLPHLLLLTASQLAERRLIHLLPKKIQIWLIGNIFAIKKNSHECKAQLLTRNWSMNKSDVIFSKGLNRFSEIKRNCDTEAPRSSWVCESLCVWQRGLLYPRPAADEEMKQMRSMTNNLGFFALMSVSALCRHTSSGSSRTKQQGLQGSLNRGFSERVIQQPTQRCEDFCCRKM